MKGQVFRVAKSPIHGKGLFATKDIKKGGKIEYIRGKKVFKIMKTREDSLSTPDWFGMSKYYWVDPGKGP